MFTGRVVKPSDLHLKYYANAAHRSKLLYTRVTSSRFLEIVFSFGLSMGFTIIFSKCISMV